MGWGEGGDSLIAKLTLERELEDLGITWLRGGNLNDEGDNGDDVGGADCHGNDDN